MWRPYECVSLVETALIHSAKALGPTIHTEHHISTGSIRRWSGRLNEERHCLAGDCGAGGFPAEGKREISLSPKREFDTLSTWLMGRNAVLNVYHGGELL